MRGMVLVSLVLGALLVSSPCVLQGAPEDEDAYKAGYIGNEIDNEIGAGRALPDDAGLRSAPPSYTPGAGDVQPRFDAASGTDGQGLVKQIIDVNTRFAFVSIALAALTAILVLLLLFRLGSIRNSIQRSARDMSNTKEALRYLMDMDKQGAARKGAEERSGRGAEPAEAAARLAAQAQLAAQTQPVAQAQLAAQTQPAAVRDDAALLRVTGALERLTMRLDDLTRAQAEGASRAQAEGSAAAGGQAGDTRAFGEDEMNREVERRLAAMRIETVEPTAGEKFDPLLHDEVDSRPSRDELDGTIFRVIQTGLVYNNRVALKARVVVNRS